VSTAPGSAVSESVLEISGLSKSFGNQRALIDVDIKLRAGEVCALIGQNGSGKSTLIKILAGYHAADPGVKLSFRGRPVSIDDRSAAWRRHVRFIHQDLGLAPTMNVLDNLALGIGYRTDRMHRIRWGEERKRASAMLAQFGLGDIDLGAPVSRLGAVEKTLIAVTRALLDWDDGEGVLVLDEPTAALSAPEVDRLFGAIRPLTERGVAILFVSHRFAESFQIADRVIVLRDGRVVASQPMAELDERSLLSLMIDGVPEEMYPTTPQHGNDQALTVRRLSGGRVHDFSLTVQEGEIVGVAGLAGSGREDIPRLLFGDLRPRSGEIVVGETRMKRPSPAAAIKLGIGLVPSDRMHRSIFFQATVRENITLPSLSPFWRRMRLDRRAERREVSTWLERVRLTPPNPEYPMGGLSGGNQQKGVIARWLRLKPKVLILDEPTHGVDMGAKTAIFGLISDAAGSGTAVVMCSSEAKDLAAVCDRVLVLNHGNVVADLSGESLTERQIVAVSLTGSVHHEQSAGETMRINA
jgi:ribose transport system ATP-binding protein